MLLAALGIYGVMAFVVSQRVQEFGIRLALGAQRRDILMLVFRPGLILTLSGAVSGVAASMIVTRLMSDAPVRCLGERSAHLRNGPDRSGTGGTAGLFHSGEAGHARVSLAQALRN